MKLMRLTENDVEYFRWLCNKIDCETRKVGYSRILEMLYSTAFYAIIPNDDNRAEDGHNLRITYFNEFGRKPREGDSSVLEVLIALSERLAFMMWDGRLKEEDQTAIWFWRLIDNLGLSPKLTIYVNHEKVINWLDRRYNEDGSGGLFPLYSPIRDQRDIEIWYQMQQYISENL